MGQRISLAPAVATALANKLYSYRTKAASHDRLVTDPSSPPPSPLSLPPAAILPRYIADHEITRIIYTTESLRLFVPSPSTPPGSPTPRHSSRSYCLASAFGIMHNSMARGLRLDAVCITIRCPIVDDDTGDSRFRAGGNAGKRNRLLRERAPRKAWPLFLFSYLSYIL